MVLSRSITPALAILFTQQDRYDRSSARVAKHGDQPRQLKRHKPAVICLPGTASQLNRLAGYPDRQTSTEPHNEPD